MFRLAFLDFLKIGWRNCFNGTSALGSTVGTAGAFFLLRPAEQT